MSEYDESDRVARRRLEAEVERLRGCDHESQHIDGHWRCLRCGEHLCSLTELEAEVERLRAECLDRANIIVGWTKEVERLRKDKAEMAAQWYEEQVSHDHVIEVYMDELAEERGEVERLRAAITTATDELENLAVNDRAFERVFFRLAHIVEPLRAALAEEVTPE